MRKTALIAGLLLMAFIACTETAIETITVTPAADTTGIGLTAQFTATARDADGNVVSDVEFTWSSSNTAVATIDANGLATGVATGSCTITAASGDVQGTAMLVVTAGPTHHSGSITADETWYPSGNPHIIDDDVSVENNATLTIMPGCVVKFTSGTELYAGYVGPGAIIANGKPDTMIYFTSNVASPSAGDWQNVGLYDYAMSTSSFSYCSFEYGGGSSSWPGEFHGNGITNIIKITNCTFKNSGNYGVYLTSDASFNTFTNNTISTCAQYPVHINAEYVRTIGSGNTLTGNTINAIEVTGGTIHTTGTWINPGVPYYIVDDIEIGDNSTSPVITIAPGNTIKFNVDVEMYAGYSATGGLIADGTSGRIRFISNVASPSPGDWYNIGFYDYAIDASSKVINCTIEYGGGSSAWPGNIYIQNALPQITGDSIGHSGNWGIYLNGSVYPNPNDLLNNNTFYDCPSGNVRVP